MVYRDGVYEGKNYQSGWTAIPMAPAMKEDFPEIESFVRLSLWYDELIFQYEQKTLAEKYVIMADSTIFDVFSIPFLQGNPHTALNRPFTMVITESTARRYFGNVNPIGKVLSVVQMGQKMEFEITGIVADQPRQSHFYFDMLYSMLTYFVFDDSNAWFNHSFMSYLLLKEGHDPRILEAKFDDFITRHMGPFIQRETGMSAGEFREHGIPYHFRLLPLKDVHLSKHVEMSKLVNEAQGSKSFIYVLSCIGLVILLIACINYINLSTAMAVNRFREVGIRKVVGASRPGLIGYYIFESILLCISAFVIGMLLVELFIPQFNALTDKSIHINYFSHPMILPAMILFIVILSFLAGFYPALILSRIKPVLIIKGLIMERQNKGGYWLRNLLVLFQFSVCIVLIIGTAVINRQVRYMLDKDLGFNKEQVLILHRANGLGESHKAFKEDLLELSGIQYVSYSFNTPARTHYNQVHHIKGDPKNVNPALFISWGDCDFINTFGMQLIEGRNFDKSRIRDQYTAILNETAARELTRKDGSQIVFDDTSYPSVDSIDYPVIGVVKDFHFAALNQDIGRWIIYPLREDIMWYAQFVSIKISSTDIASVLDQIERLWKEHTNDYPFEYTFLDDDYELMYKREIRTQKMLSAFSFLAIIIACLGLLGLAAFITNQKTRQIGIRKAMGSTSLQVQTLLSMQFSRWILFAALIAWPVSLFILRNWLQNFAYRINMPYGIFVIAVLGTMVIALATVSYHSWHASRRNPADSLKYE
jgi:putative ABC transport system permease protein